MKATLILVACGFCILSSKNANSSPAEFKCEKAYDEMPSEYALLVCAGNSYLERGRATEALENYRKAAEIKFFEAPNFLIYYRIAAASALKRNKAEAQAAINSLRIMLKIYTGSTNCKLARQLDRVAEAVMCSHAFDVDQFGGSYGLKERKLISKEYIERIDFLQIQLDRLTKAKRRGQVSQEESPETK